MTTAPVAKRKREWFVVIRTLMRYGVSMGQISAATGRNKSAVKHWQNGGEPKESDARIVLALLAKAAPEEYRRLQAPFEIRVDDGPLGQVAESKGESDFLPDRVWITKGKGLKKYAWHEVRGSGEAPQADISELARTIGISTSSLSAHLVHDKSAPTHKVINTRLGPRNYYPRDEVLAWWEKKATSLAETEVK